MSAAPRHRKTGKPRGGVRAQLGKRTERRVTVVLNQINLRATVRVPTFDFATLVDCPSVRSAMDYRQEVLAANPGRYE